MALITEKFLKSRLLNSKISVFLSTVFSVLIMGLLGVIAINYSSLETWDNLDMTWETLTRKWEDISYDGKSKIPKWHRVNSFDKELNKVTQKKELRNK